MLGWYEDARASTEEPQARAGARFEGLHAELVEALGPDAHLGKVRRYLRGEHDLPYIPRGATSEFRRMAEKARTNWLPLVAETYSQNLHVDGYRPADEARNVGRWDDWQANGMDARQSIVHRGVVEYGTAYVWLDVQGDGSVSWKPMSPLHSRAWYADTDSETPLVAIRRVSVSADAELWEYRDTAVGQLWEVSARERSYRLVSEWESEDALVPVVRFRDRLDDVARGFVAPAIPLQDAINETSFMTRVAMQYSSFRQRWATGLVIPVDERESLPDGSPNPMFGKPIETFEAAANRLWVADAPDAKFGDFGQTDINGHLSAYTSQVKSLAAVSQISPSILMGDLSNLSAEALAQLETSTQRRIAALEVVLGESWELCFRLAAELAGDSDAAADRAAQVRWRDTEARNLAATVDALTKLGQSLGVPVEALWERIPGVTDTDLELWRSLKHDTSPLAAIAEQFRRQSGEPEAAE